MIGIVILAHERLNRVAQLARHLVDRGCRVVIHVDGKVEQDAYDGLLSELAEDPGIAFAGRVRCEWGTFSLVEAGVSAVELLLSNWPEVTHVCQISGVCLPVRPIDELIGFLGANPGTDFIEAVPLGQKSWVAGGLSEERLTLFHIFSWRRQRAFFDRSVRVQRKLGIRRKIPRDLDPHMGSQWWCLSRQTLERILGDPDLPTYKRFFRHVWIPDESFFQSLAARHSDKLVSQSLTFAQFDPQGKPFYFYDDHRDILLQMDAYFARKIWWGADELYRTFLSADAGKSQPERRQPEEAMKRLIRAQNIRIRGRHGLLGVARHPRMRYGGPSYQTARPYTVFDGFDAVFPDMNAVLNTAERVDAHGHILAEDRIEFAGSEPEFTGNLTANVAIRDYRPEQFLVSLLWAGRRHAQIFHHDFRSDGPLPSFVLSDPNALVIRLCDAWLLPLIDSARPEQDAEIAFAAEKACRERLRKTGAEVLNLSIAEFLADRTMFIEAILDALPPHVPVAEALTRPGLPIGLADSLGPLLSSYSDAQALVQAVETSEPSAEKLVHKKSQRRI